MTRLTSLWTCYGDGNRDGVGSRPASFARTGRRRVRPGAILGRLSDLGAQKAGPERSRSPCASSPLRCRTMTPHRPRSRRASGSTRRRLSYGLEDVDHGALRYRWNKNVLEIGARHPSLQRYLGPKSEQYPGQDRLHFRVLLAEVVAEAPLLEALAREHRVEPQGLPKACRGMTTTGIFARMMSEFLPKAHGLMAPGV